MVTYNILADKYATGGMHQYCPPQFLAWPYRKQRILEELLGLRPDILALQEVGAARAAELGPRALGQALGCCAATTARVLPPTRHPAPCSPSSPSTTILLPPRPPPRPLPSQLTSQVERPFFEAELEPLMAQHGYEALYFSRRRRCGHGCER